jgi:hypothetical protein
MGMNKGARLTGIVLLSTVLHYPAMGASVCQDRNAAITIADLESQITDLLINGEAGDPRIAAHEQRIAQLARAHCFKVDSLPPQRTNTLIKWGCRVFSGPAPVSGDTVKTLYWTRCPGAVE